MPIGYTYVTTIETGKVTLFYAGKKQSAVFVPTYHGSGVILRRLKKRSDVSLRVEVQSWHETPEELNAAEVDLIAALKREHGRRCINISIGGDGNNRQLWESDAGFRKKMLAVATSEPRRRSVSEGQARAWQDPTVRQRRSAAIAAAFSDPEVRKRKRDACIEANKRPELRLKRRQTSLAMWSDPEAKARRVEQMKVFMNTPEAAAKRAAAIRAAWARRKAQI